MVLIGIFLCFTVIGVIIGLPLILAGIVMIFVGPIFGFAIGSHKKLRAQCPFCDLLLDVPMGAIKQGWVDCCGCQSRILIVNNQLVKPRPPQ